MYNSIVCRYHEIATKGNNRLMFENKLIENMKYLCSDVEGLSFQRVRGRIFIHRTSDKLPFSPEELEKIKDALSRTFGLESFSPAVECAPDLSQILEIVKNTAPDVFEKELKNSETVEFRISSRRSDKRFPLTSNEINIRAAEVIFNIFGEDRLKVNLTKHQVNVGIEIRERHGLVYYESFKGPGGLPVGTNASVLALLSGGIDSPVACHMTMKRGCHVDYLTFHSFPYTPMESLDKVKRLGAVLNRYQKKGVLFACNLSEVQKLIRDNCNQKYRTVLYRRMMMRIASMLCRDKRFEAIITGESMGQVASQTIRNMSVINESIPDLIIRPLAGLDKIESIERAQKIGTFNISIEDFPDSCTVFAPPSPSIAAKLELVREEESMIPDLENVLKKAYDEIEKIIL